MMVFLIIVIILIFTFAFLSGFNGSAAVVAPLISSRAANFKAALIIASTGNLIGPLVFGTFVAKTIGEGLFEIKTFKLETIFFALIAAVIWNTVTWYFGIPSSSSHTLIGALLGATIVLNGFSSLILPGLYKVILFLLLSPAVGFIAGYVITEITNFALKNSKPKANNYLRISQIPLSLLLSVGSGANNAQRTTALMAMVFFISGFYKNFNISFWMLASNAVAAAAGSLLGGRRIIKTVGEKIYNIRPVNGFASLAASSAVIIASNLLGGPISSTHILSSSLVGSGASERVNKVRWHVINRILFVLFFTIPITAAISMLLSYIYKLIKGMMI